MRTIIPERPPPVIVRPIKNGLHPSSLRNRNRNVSKIPQNVPEVKGKSFIQLNSSLKDI